MVARVPKEKLTHAIIQQMRIYAKAYEEQGWYYGNKAQFKVRHVKILAWLDALEEGTK